MKLKTWIAITFTRPKLTSMAIEAGRTLLAIILAYLVAFVIIGLVSDDPVEAVRWFVLGPVSSFSEFGEVLKNATPLIFAGIAACIIIKGGQFNMFTEGAFYVGGLTTALAAIYLHLPGLLSIVVSLIAGIAVSGVIGYIPAKLRAKYNVNEFVSSIMFNFIVMWIGVWLISNIVIDVSSGDNATLPIPDIARLSILISGTNVTTGILIAMGVTVLVFLFLYRTKAGYELRMTGDNQSFARHIGIDVKKNVVLSQILGIGIAGLGGGVEILANYRRFNWKTLPGYGFDGFMVAILAKNRPLFVPFAALFIGYLRTGADLMAFNSDIAQEVVQIIQGLILIFVASEAFFSSDYFHGLLAQRRFKKINVPKSEVTDHV